MLTGAQRTFLNRAVPRILKEIDCLKDIEFLDYTNFPENLPPENKADLIGYRQGFLIHAFVELTGMLFFISHSLYDDTPLKSVGIKHPVKKKQRDELMDKYIEFCKSFGRIHKI
jgi:hypothetical protein